MLKTFSSGIGLIAIVPEEEVDTATGCFASDGGTVVPIGRVVEGEGVAYSGALL